MTDSNKNQLLHKWETEWVNYKDIKYNKPIVDYKKQKDLALKMFSAAFK